MKYSFLILAALLVLAALIYNPVIKWLGPAPMPYPSDVFSFDGHTFYIPDIEELAVRGYLEDAIEAEGLDWGDAEVDAAVEICWLESEFYPYCTNELSTSFGLFGFLDSTRANYGITKDDDQLTQTRAFVRYVRDRYGTPTDALEFWNTKHEVNGKMVNYY